MSHLFGVGLPIEINKINTNFRMILAKKGGIGIRSLGVIFRRHDNNGNKKLDFEEFQKCLAAFGLFPTVVQLQTLFKYFDVDGDGNINYDEFLRGLREPLSGRRLAITQQAYELLDRHNAGYITVDDISSLYDVSRNSDFISGKATREEILQIFLQGFEGLGGNKDGIISKQEWIDYYSDVSMGIESSDYFCGMMEACWGICETSGSAQTKDTVKTLLATIRQKLISFSNQKSDEYVLRTLFKEFDTNKNGNMTVDELGAMLVKLQISCDRRYLHELLAQFDRNGNGVIEFEEFVNFIIHNPYK